MGRHMLEELETKKTTLIETVENFDMNESLADGEALFEVRFKFCLFSFVFGKLGEFSNFL
jgi:hypothetical protein